MSLEEKTGREQMREAMALLDLVRSDALKAIEWCPDRSSSQRQKMRERVAAGAYALRGALEEVERWALP